MSEMQVGLSDLVILFASFLCFILIIALISRSSIRKTWNIFLVIFLVITTGRLIVKFASATGYLLDYPHLFRLNIFLGILSPSLSYLFLHFFIWSKKKVSGFTLLHFVIPLTVFFYMLPFYLLSAKQKTSYLLHQEYIDVSLLPDWYKLAGVLYSLFYLGLISRDFYKLVKGASESRLKKLKSVVIPVLITSLISYAILIVLLGLDHLLRNEADWTLYAYQSLSIAIIIGFVRLVGFKNLFEKGAEDLESKYASSGLTEQKKKVLIDQLGDLMSEEKLFMKEKFKLKDLAEALQVPEYSVSQVINQGYDCSFTDYINKLRVEEAKEMLKDETQSHISIEGIGYQVGFNSRATFYTAFKKFAGTTPSDFRKK